MENKLETNQLNLTLRRTLITKLQIYIIMLKNLIIEQKEHSNIYKFLLPFVMLLVGE